MKKNSDVNVAGRIISVLFFLILVAGIYFLVNLFKGVEITPENMAGEWKLPGSPVTYYSFGLDGTATSYEKFTGTGDVRNQVSYTYTLESNDKGVMELTLTPEGSDTDIVIKVTSLSQAQMSVIMNGSDMCSLTRVDVF